jgi:hypothetical protein
MAMLLVDSKIANYSVAPHSGTGPFQVGFPAVGKWLSAGKWQSKTERIGTRWIDGIEVEGTRIVQTSEDQPPLMTIHEKWSSRSLGLTFEVEASGRAWRHTAKLQKLDRREPDPVLFVIPPDYRIQE